MDIPANAEKYAIPVSLIIDNVMEGIVVIDAKGQIATFNRAAENLFGYAAAEVMGRNVSVLMPEPHASGHDGNMARYASTGQTRVMGVERDLYGLRRDSTTFPISIRITEVQLYGARHFIGVINDITERKKINDQIAAYHAQLEKEKQMAQALMDKIVRHDALNEPLLQWYTQPSDSFCGDLVAAQRSADGLLHVLLADATGHGLASAISLLPTLGIFYTMVDKGFGMRHILAEINRRLSETLPADRFLAGIFVTVDEKARSISIWNGSMPPCYLVANASGVMRELRSVQPPLGILKPDKFDASRIELAWSEPCDIILYSDGLIEAENAEGEAFGEERLRAAIAGEVNGRFNRILASLTAHLSGHHAHDDVSLAMIRLP
jgi:PAS domain S-box-containing protein